MSEKKFDKYKDNIKNIFAGGGEMGARMRATDWSQTPLGAIETWSNSLKTAVSICLNSRFPMVIWWGRELVLLYNDGWRPILGANKDKIALGSRGKDVWAEIWDVLGPMFAQVLDTGEATWNDDGLLLVNRYGFTEEAYFTWSYSPIRDDDGRIGGVFTAVTETTRRVIGERRLRTLRDLGERTAETETADEACAAAIRTLAENPKDLPFAALYLIDREGKTAELCETAGIEKETLASPKSIEIGGEFDIWNFQKVLRSGKSEIIGELEAKFGKMPGGAWNDAPDKAIVLPLAKAGTSDDLTGFLVAGLSPNLAFDDDYRAFSELVAGHITTVITNARALESEANIRYQKTLLEALNESVLDGILIVSPEGRMLHFNQHFLDIWNFPAEIIESQSDEAALNWAANQTVNPADFLARVSAAYEQPDAQVREELSMKDGRVYERFGASIYDGEKRLGWAWTFRNITERKRAELNSQFLVKLDAQLNRLTEPEEIEQCVVDNLGAYFDIERCYFGHINGEQITVIREFSRRGAGVSADYRLADFFSPEAIERFCSGIPLIVSDVKTDPRTAESAANYATPEIRAFITTPVLYQGEWVSTFNIVSRMPRIWREDELELVREVSVRVYPHIERARAAKALQKSEAHLSVVFARAKVGLSEISVNGRFRRVNDELCRILGRTREEILKLTVADITHAEDMPPGVKSLNHLIETGEPVSFNKRFLRPNGEIVWANSTLSLLDVAQNAERTILAVTVDLTERRKAEQAERERNRQLDLLARTSQQLILSGKPDTALLQTVFDDVRESIGTEFFFNFLIGDEPETLYLAASGGLSQEQKDFFATIHFGEYLCGMVAERRERCIVENLQECEFSEADALRKAGVLCYGGFPLIAHHRLIGTIAFATRTRTHFREGELQMVQTVCDQVAATLERSRIEGQLRESEERFARAFNSSPLSVTITSLKTGKLVEVNETFVELTGYSRAEAIGRTTAELGLWSNPPDRSKEMTAVLRQGHIRNIEYVFRMKNGTEIVGLLSAELLEIGGEQCALTVIQDITDRKQVEKEREKLLEQEQILRRQAEEANRLKDEFLATVSHELRTPLNAILGWATIVRQNNFDAKIMRRAFEIIERNSRNQNQIISDILDVSRIITGKLKLNLKPLELSKIIRAAIDTVHPAIAAKRIRLETHLEPDFAAIPGDGDRLQQIFWNLLSNAVKFTPEGGSIKVRLEYRQDYAKIVVADSGSGIAPEFLAFVFDRFRQADGSANRAHGGLGVGLAIVRNLVELHGGNVAAESGGQDRGSTFTVHLPLSARYAESDADDLIIFTNSEKPSESVDNPRGKLNKLKILIVDDEADALELTAFILTEQGAEVFTADSADKALEILKSENPEILISDIGMPEKDGYQLIREIKKQSDGQNRPAAAIALTAYAGETDNRRILQAGYQACLPKPVEPAELIEKIIELTSQNQQHETYQRDF